jgi:hypothetical protein
VEWAQNRQMVAISHHGFQWDIETQIAGQRWKSGNQLSAGDKHLTFLGQVRRPTAHPPHFSPPSAAFSHSMGASNSTSLMNN